MKPRKLMQNGVSPNPILNDPPSEQKVALTFEPNSPFYSSMGFMALILLSALFFMGFFSLYIRRCAQGDSSSDAEPNPDTPPAPLRQATLHENKDVELSSTVGSLVSYGGEEKDCVICLSELRGGETVRVVPCCRHVFHPGCVDTWLLAHMSCPLCRSTNVFAAKEVRLGATGTGDGEASTAEN